MTEAQFLTMPAEGQAHMGVQLGRGAFHLHPQWRLQELFAECLILQDVGEGLWHISEQVLSRLLPGYAMLDFTTDVVEGILEVAFTPPETPDQSETESD